nr:immunoglobulin light chain junction region [Macaca mulatta]
DYYCSAWDGALNIHLF